MSRLDRMLEIASLLARAQARRAARETERIVTGAILTLIAALLLGAAAVVMLVSLYLGLESVLPPAGALAIVGGVLALLGLATLLTTMLVNKR